MKLVSDAYREVGKTLINIGQGIFIAMLLALLLKNEVNPWLGLLGITGGFVFIVLGVSFVQKAYHKRKSEQRKK